MALVFIRPVANLAEPVEEYGTTERILLLAFVETDVTALRGNGQVVASRLLCLVVRSHQNR